MTELFDVPESLSPYDQWERRHDIHAHRIDGIVSEAEDGVHPWSAWQGECVPDDRVTGFGDERKEAIADLCRKRRIPLYGADAIKRKDGE